MTNYEIVSRTPIAECPNKNIKNTVKVLNHRSGRYHHGFEHHDGTVEIAVRNGVSCRMKLVHVV